MGKSGSKKREGGGEGERGTHHALIVVVVVRLSLMLVVAVVPWHSRRQQQQKKNKHQHQHQQHFCYCNIDDQKKPTKCMNLFIYLFCRLLHPSIHPFASCLQQRSDCNLQPFLGRCAAFCARVCVCMCLCLAFFEGSKASWVPFS
jgi:hypothetical protein